MQSVLIRECCIILCQAYFSSQDALRILRERAGTEINAWRNLHSFVENRASATFRGQNCVHAWLASLYLAAHTRNRAAVCLPESHIAALRGSGPTGHHGTETPFLPHNIVHRSRTALLASGTTQQVSCFLPVPGPSSVSSRHHT